MYCNIQYRKKVCVVKQRTNSVLGHYVSRKKKNREQLYNFVLNHSRQKKNTNQIFCLKLVLPQSLRVCFFIYLTVTCLKLSLLPHPTLCPFPPKTHKTSRSKLNKPSSDRLEASNSLTVLVGLKPSNNGPCRYLGGRTNFTSIRIAFYCNIQCSLKKKEPLSKAEKKKKSRILPKFGIHTKDRKIIRKPFSSGTAVQQIKVFLSKIPFFFLLYQFLCLFNASSCIIFFPSYSFTRKKESNKAIYQPLTYSTLLTLFSLPLDQLCDLWTKILEEQALF